MEENFTHNAEKSQRGRNRNRKLNGKNIVHEKRIKSAVQQVRTRIVAIDDDTVINLSRVRNAADIYTDD